MAATDPLVPMEVTLYSCPDEYADENTVGAVWTIVGYVTGFSLTKNRNEMDKYLKRDKVCTKLGRNEFTGSISQVFTQNSAGIWKLFNDGLPVALKAEFDKDYTGTAQEVMYLSNVYFKNGKIDFGDTNNSNDDVVMSADFSYTDDHVVTV